MSKEFLNLLFYAVNAECGAPNESRNLNQLYKREQSVLNALGHIESRLLSMGVCVEDDFENDIGKLLEEFERQGFVNGFRMGMMLRDELNIGMVDTNTDKSGCPTEKEKYEQIKSLYDAGAELDVALLPLEQAISALTVTLEAMEQDGLQPKREINKDFAVNFAVRFPMYHETLNLILRNLQSTYADLRAGVDSIYEAGKKQREERQEVLA